MNSLAVKIRCPPRPPGPARRTRPSASVAATHAPVNPRPPAWRPIGTSAGRRTGVRSGRAVGPRRRSSRGAGRATDRRARVFAKAKAAMVDWRGRQRCRIVLPAAPPPGTWTALERHVRDRGDRPLPGIPRPARRRLLAPVQHRVPGGLPGRDELPRLPEPRRRGPVRGGLHPVPRAEPGRGDVLVRLLRSVRAGLPPRRHRPAARDPGDEAVPRGVARGLGHPRRHAPDHAARRAGRRRRRRAGRHRGRPRAGDEGRRRRRSSTACPYGGGTMLIGVPAFRLPREAIEMDVRLVERLGRRVPASTRRSASTSRSRSSSATTTRSP